MAVLRRQRPTRFHKHANVLLSFWRRRLHAGNCRGCGQVSWPCRENKNREILFLACLSVIRENLCSQKFPAIRYIWNSKNVWYGWVAAYVEMCVVCVPPTIRTIFISNVWSAVAWNKVWWIMFTEVRPPTATQLTKARMCQPTLLDTCVLWKHFNVHLSFVPNLFSNGFTFGDTIGLPLLEAVTQ